MTGKMSKGNSEIDLRGVLSIIILGLFGVGVGLYLFIVNPTETTSIIILGLVLAIFSGFCAFIGFEVLRAYLSGRK